MKTQFEIAIVAALFISPAVALANPSQIDLVGEVKLEKTISEDGKTRVELLEPKVVVPGDRLLFTTRYNNRGTQAASNFVVTNPLPAAVVLSHDAAEGYVVSVDGGKTWGPLAAAKLPDGKGGLRPATASDVTHLRWTVASIAPGASGMVRYHAIVR